MKEKIEGKRKTNKIKIVFIVILVVAVLIYAGYTAWQLFAHPTDVFLVEQGSISEEIKAEGYIIRDETKVQGNNYKNGIVQIKAEGEKCAKDENIFRYYSTGEDELIQKIQELDEKIDEAQKSDTTSILPGDIKLLDEEIELRLKEISKNNNIQSNTPSKSLPPNKDFVLDLFGLKLYFDDVLILSLIFFLYKEDVKDEGLFLALVLLLIS